MTQPTQPLSDTELREAIASMEVQIVFQEGDYSSHEEGKLEAESVEAIMHLIRKDREATRQRHEGIGAYMAISSLLRNVGYLLEHRRQGSLPIMTAEVVGDLYSQMQQTLNENVSYMRSAHNQKEGE